MKGKIVTAVFTLVLLVGSITADANSATRCKVLSIEASNSKSGLDSKLSQYRTIFKKAPFSQYDSFVLKDSQYIELDIQAPTPFVLPDTIEGSLLLKQRKKGQFQLTLTITRKGQKPISIDGFATPGAPLFAAGLKSPNGVWIFGVTCERDNDIVKY